MFKPTRQNFRIVIKKDEILSLSQRRAPVASINKAFILFISDHSQHIPHGRQYFTSLVSGSIIRDNDFSFAQIDFIHQRTQALPGERRFIEDRNNYRRLDRNYRAAPR